MLQNICRICANDADELTKLFEKNARKMVRHIKLLTGVFLESKPNLPDVICKSCLHDLECAIEFRRRCLRSHKRWHLTKSAEPESPIGVQSTNVICVRRSTRSRMRYVGDEEPLSPVEVLIKVEHPKCDTVDDDSIDHLQPEKQPNNDNRLDICVSEEELYVPSRKEKHSHAQPRTKQKLPVFFCDQCGNNVTGKSAFDRHLRKHSGIRPFQCEQCPARFLSAGELKGHKVMHTGDRNFPCRYCDRTYVNYSGRLRHERTHTNERPFSCVQCGKAFTNSYILKNHMLVHTGERMYRCDLCDRAFSRPTHLKTHYRSNTHQQNVEKSSAEQLQSIKSDKLQTQADVVLP